MLLSFLLCNTLENKEDYLLYNNNLIPQKTITCETMKNNLIAFQPYYPVNDEKNGALYSKYRELAQKEKKVVFGGRLGEYKYYDMDAVIASALDMCEKELG